MSPSTRTPVARPCRAGTATATGTCPGPPGPAAASSRPSRAPLRLDSRPLRCGRRPPVAGTAQNDVAAAIASAVASFLYACARTLSGSTVQVRAHARNWYPPVMKTTDAWAALLRVHATVLPALDQELQAAHGLPTTWYDVLLELNAAPGRQLTMSQLGAVAVVSRSR